MKRQRVDKEQLWLFPPYFDNPKTDNQKLLNYQYDYLFYDNMQAWEQMWNLSYKIAKKQVLKLCNKYHRTMPKPNVEEMALNATMYVLRRFRTRKGYMILKPYGFTLALWYSSKQHFLKPPPKKESRIIYVDEEDLYAEIERGRKVF